MAWTHVQGQARRVTTSPTSLTLTFGAALTPGNVVQLGIGFSNVVRTVSTVSDGSNTWTLLDGPSDITNDRSYVYFCYVTVGGITVVTITLSGASTNMALCADEFAPGVPSPLGVSQNGTNTGLAAAVTAMSPSNGSLIVGTVQNVTASTHAAGTGYLLGADNGNLQTSNANVYNLCASGSPPSETAPVTLGTSVQWYEFAQEYKPQRLLGATGAGM